MTICEGAYSLVLLTRDALYGVRDRYGLRPLCLGEIKKVSLHVHLIDHLDYVQHCKIYRSSGSFAIHDSNQFQDDSDERLGYCLASESCALSTIGATYAFFKLMTHLTKLQIPPRSPARRSR